MSNNEDLIKKIKTLLDKSGRTEAEAASAAGLAQKLLEKHNLSMQDLDTLDDDDNATGHENLDTEWIVPWKTAIATSCASLYYCDYFHDEWFDSEAWSKVSNTHSAKVRAFEEKHGNRFWEYTAEVRAEERKLRKDSPKIATYYRPRLVMVGRPHNRIICMEMIKYLWEATNRLAREYSKERQEQREFKRGCGERLSERVWRLAWEARTAAEKAAKRQPGTAVALYDQFDQENDAYKAANFKLKKRKSGGIDAEGDHAEAGREAGDRVSLAPQLGGTGAGSSPASLPAPAKALPAPKPAKRPRKRRPKSKPTGDDATGAL